MLLKKARKHLAVLLVCVMVFAGSALAAGQTGTIHCSSYLNVRTAGNTGAPVVGRLYNGVQISILSSNNGWYQISYNSSSAWVSGLYVTVTGTDSRIQTVVNTAKSMEGVKYVFGGATPSGFDCSGLVVYSYAKAGITLPHSSTQLATKGIAVSRSALKPGDLVFFDTNGGNDGINHVGIYLGNNIFVSAASGAGRVMESSLTNSFWSAAYMSARRIIY